MHGQLHVKRWLEFELAALNVKHTRFHSSGAAKKGSSANYNNKGLRKIKIAIVFFK